MTSNKKVYFLVPTIVLTLVVFYKFVYPFSQGSASNKPIASQNPAKAVVDHNSLPAEEAVEQQSSTATPVAIPNASLEHTARPDHEEVSAIDSALAAINSTDVEARLYGIQQLAFLNPDLAVSSIYEAFERIETEPDVEGMIILGALTLGNNRMAFDDKTVHNLYDKTNSDNIKGRLARILSYRGDDSVLVSYLSDIEPKLTYGVESERIDILLMLGSVESKLTVPYIKPYLTDPDEGVRIAALTALSLSSNEEELHLVKPMLVDESEFVRNNAELVIDYLSAKGKAMPVPLDIVEGLGDSNNYF